MADIRETPTLAREERLAKDGYAVVAGIDEAGRGALAGPVTAAAVVLPAGAALAGVWSQVRDSKLLTAKRRSELADQIKQAALTWGIGDTAPAIIDEIGIAAATRQAMAAALNALWPRPDYLLIDWVRLPTINIPQESFAKADRTCVSVAAASILAKVHRDRTMVELDKRYPEYRFADNKGYGSLAHREALARVGPCPKHRFSFAPIALRPTLFEQSPPPDGATDEEA